MPAPIALFAYARPWHTRQALDALLRNPEAPETDLVAFCDAARHPGVAEPVAQVRALLRGVTGFRSVRLVEREQNLGLARSIISGVGEVLDAHGQVIVVEDDLVVSPYFLAYMNEGLRRYADDARVASIHAYQYPLDRPVPPLFFLRGADCWGWATWSRAWRHFRPDAAQLAAQLQQQGLVRSFDMDGRYPFHRMLRRQAAGQLDSWAIRWHASAWLDGMLTLYPGRSHALNIGADGSGTHCATTVDLGDALADQPTDWGAAPPVQEDAAGREAVARALQQIRRRLWVGRLRRLVGLQPQAVSA